MPADPSRSPTRMDTLIRLLYVILFAMIFNVAELVLAALVALQFVFVFIWEEPNTKLKDFSASLSRYIYQILEFVTFRSDTKPFPFADWSGASDSQADY